MRAGLDRAELLLAGHGQLDLTAGVAHPWSGPVTAYARAELVVRPAQHLDLFADVQADTVGLSVGAGVRVPF